MSGAEPICPCCGIVVPKGGHSHAGREALELLQARLASYGFRLTPSGIWCKIKT